MASTWQERNTEDIWILCSYCLDFCSLDLVALLYKLSGIKALSIILSLSSVYLNLICFQNPYLFSVTLLFINIYRLNSKRLVPSITLEIQLMDFQDLRLFRLPAQIRAEKRRAATNNLPICKAKQTWRRFIHVVVKSQQ